ncbi:MAG: alkaline phosphatase family protein, partial [Planctomycetota bacterium]
MVEYLVFLSIPGLREKDVAVMRNLRRMTAGGEIVNLEPSFPCVTCPVQANMTTGLLPREHGVIGNGFYWRDKRRVEMWTSPNDCILKPQLWDLLSHHEAGITTAVWFPLHSVGCEADYVCTPKPIHNPDGTETMWCYTRPTELYEELREELGDFPLHHFWGPLAGIQGTNWIVESAIRAARLYRPRLFYIYLPHLDYAAQRSGPDSPEAEAAVSELDQALGRLAEGMRESYDTDPAWLIAGEYAITPVQSVVYPNRILREAGLLAVEQRDDGEHLDLEKSRAFAVVDHQFSHIYVQDDDPQTMQQVVELFEGREGIAEVLAGAKLIRYELLHPRSGDVVLVSTPDSWQAYYWWHDDAQAPGFARTVDIHRKPGYDPVELCLDPATRSIPLDASLIGGSHGAPVHDPSQLTVAVSSTPGVFPETTVRDTQIFDVVL